MCSATIADCYVSNHLTQSQAAAPLLDNDFDLSEQTFEAIFQNIKSCKYSNINSIFFNNRVEHLFLFHLNIRSLQKNFDDLQEIIYSFKEKPHIICLSETKIKNNPLLNFSIPGYKFVNANSLTKCWWCWCVCFRSISFWNNYLWLSICWLWTIMDSYQIL